MTVSAGTIARTICLVLALLNQGMAIMGREELPIAEDSIYQLTSLCFTMIASVCAWWKNNSFTKAAREADMIMNKFKEQ